MLYINIYTHIYGLYYVGIHTDTIYSTYKTFVHVIDTHVRKRLK